MIPEFLTEWKNSFAIATSILLFYFVEHCWYIIGLDNLFLLISARTLFMRIIIKKRVEFEMKMFHLAACTLGWLMRSLRPQKCNLISSVNLDRKWPKQNWFSVLHISCVCHRLPAESLSSRSRDYNSREFVLIGYRGREMKGWLFRFYVLLLWSNCRDDDRGIFSSNQRTI